MDVIAVSICVLGIIVIFGATVRPGAPDPEDPDEAARSLAENMPALFAVLVLTAAIVFSVLYR